MKIHRIDHIGINVEDLAAAKAFFLDLGLEAIWEGEMQGDLLNAVTGLDDSKTALVMMRTADGRTNIELVQYLMPLDENGIRPNFSNTLGIRHICFAVEDIEAVVAKLKARGTVMFSEIQNYEDTYKLCYIRGPEGIILELAQEVG